MKSSRECQIRSEGVRFVRDDPKLENSRKGQYIIIDGWFTFDPHGGFRGRTLPPLGGRLSVQTLEQSNTETAKVLPTLNTDH